MVLDKAQQNPGQIKCLNTSTEATVVVVVVVVGATVVMVGAAVVVPSQYPQVAWQFAITFDFEHFPLLSLLAHFVEVQMSSHASVAAVRLAKRDSRM